MKKLFKSIVCMLLVTTLFGCSGPKPKETVKSALDDFKNQKISEIGDYFTDGIPKLENDKDNSSTDKEENSLDDIKNEKDIIDKFFNIDYSIEEEKVEKDTATVKVKITSYNIGEKLNEGFTNAMQIAFANAFSGISEEELQKKTTDAFINPLRYAEKNMESTVDVKLIKKDGKWLIKTDDNTSFINATTGGLWEFAEKMNQFSSSNQ